MRSVRHGADISLVPRQPMVRRDTGDGRGRKLLPGDGGGKSIVRGAGRRERWEVAGP